MPFAGCPGKDVDAWMDHFWHHCPLSRMGRLPHALEPAPATSSSAATAPAAAAVRGPARGTASAAAFFAGRPPEPLLPAIATAAGRPRTIVVEVRDGNVEAAVRRYKRLLRSEGTLKALRSRTVYVKPSQRRVEARKDREARTRRADFRRKMRWIEERQQRGF
eukprot:SM000025S08352  [mRNA]  locus=s25:264727:267768:+ [translate_table: standard]